MSNIETRGSLETRKDFKNTPHGQYRYWMTELGASERNLRDFRKMGGEIVKRYLGGTHGRVRADIQGSAPSRFHLNLFHSNVTTLQAMLFGSLPKVRVSRRHDDPNDDVGRVSAMILERLLNNDIQDNGKEWTSILRATIQDRLLPGLGCARLRYTYDPNTQMEDAVVDYFHWRDVQWGWARTFSEVPWIAFRSWLPKDKVAERFGEEVSKKVRLKGESVSSDDKNQEQYEDTNSPWRKAEVWEIWDKERRQVVWVSPGYDKVLDTKRDPLGLSGFYPCPPFLFANQTTSLYVPVSDYSLAQDLYNEVDTLQTRISIITEAVKVVGVYDSSAEGISRMFKEGVDNDLIPVDNWALFAEKGGIEGQVDWVPISEISETLLRLRELRDEAIGLLQQVTGMSDIMRGELHGQYEGVGQSELKEKYGSVRIQALQDEFAQFASDLLQIKAEIIGRHFSPETIARFANVNETFDVELVPAAIQLIKNPVEAKLRVEVRPESLSMVDYAQLRQERTEYITAIGSFLTAAAPIVEGQPSAKPFLLELLKWGLAGFKGSNDVEGVVDKAIEAAKSEQPQDEQNPEAVKAELQIQLETLKHQHAVEQLQLKMQADVATRQDDLQADIAKRNAELQAELAEIQANLHAALAEIKVKMQADVAVEQQTSQANMVQSAVETQGEIEKERVKAELDMEKQEHQTAQKIKEIKSQPKPTAPKPSSSK